MKLTLKHAPAALLLLFSLAAWWFVACYIRPEIHYFLQQTAFLTETSFFYSFARYPGGIADYLAEFISQFFLFNTLGSFLVVLVPVLMGLIACSVIRRMAGKLAFSFSVFAALLLGFVLVQMNYNYPFYAGVRLLLAFIWVWIFSSIRPKNTWGRTMLPFLLAVLLFYLAGGAALITFAVSVILIQLKSVSDRTEVSAIPVFALFAGLLPWLAYRYFFLVDFSLVYSITHARTPKILFYEPDTTLYVLYAILPFSLLVTLVYDRVKKHGMAREAASAQPSSEIRNKEKQNRVGRNAGDKEHEGDSPRLERLSSGFWLAVQSVLFAGIAFGAVKVGFNQTDRNKNLIALYAANRNWEKVITLARSIPEYDLFVNVAYNRALANTGKLSADLFGYRQLAGSGGLFVDGAVTSNVPFICSDQFYDLGFMNESQHWTFEAQTIFPNSPRLMKRLVELNLVKGKYHLAEKFLDRLDKNMLYTNWVSDYRRYVDDTTLVMKNPEFAQKRKNEPREEFTAGSFTPKLDKMLQANPANKMAFDYLLSYFLLEGDLSDFVSFLKDNRNLIRYPLPNAWDEALILYYYLSGMTPSADDPKVSRETRTRFVSFVKAMKPFGNDWRAAQKALQPEFGDTYWYYLKCLSPKVTKAQIKREKFDE